MVLSWLPAAAGPSLEFSGVLRRATCSLGLNGLVVIGNRGGGSDNGMGGNADENGHDGSGNDDDDDDDGDADHFYANRMHTSGR